MDPDTSLTTLHRQGSKRRWRRIEPSWQADRLQYVIPRLLDSSDHGALGRRTVAMDALRSD